MVEECVLEKLCEAEVPLLLRYAVCEDTEPVVMAAVQATHALLVTTADQVCGTPEMRSFLCSNSPRCSSRNYWMSIASVILAIGSLL